METNRMASRAGQMNAARTAKLAPSDACERARGAPPARTGRRRAPQPPGPPPRRHGAPPAARHPGRVHALALDVQAGRVGFLLIVTPLLVGDLLPALLDLLERLVGDTRA